MESRKILYITGIAVAIAISCLFLYFFLLPRGPVCGNGVCEYFETPTKCCIDCDCYPGSICNQTSNKCEKRLFRISNEGVKEIIENYYSSLGKNVTSIEVADIVNVGNKIGRRSIVHFGENPEDWKGVIVTEDEQIIEEEKIG